MIVKSNIGQQKICLVCGKRNQACDECKRESSKSK
jgi:hypothetical protein